MAKYERLVSMIPFDGKIRNSVLDTPESLKRYSLPKGNVVCRLEEYVQLHTPMKLNIGVGGQ